MRDLLAKRLLQRRTSRQFEFEALTLHPLSARFDVLSGEMEKAPDWTLSHDVSFLKNKPRKSRETDIKERQHLRQ
jgi:hypothetical protein